MKLDPKIRSRPVRNLKPVGRNDKCWCGSDLKYKKCCLEKDSMFGDKYDQPIYRLETRKYYEDKKGKKNG